MKSNAEDLCQEVRQSRRMATTGQVMWLGGSLLLGVAISTRLRGRVCDAGAVYGA